MKNFFIRLPVSVNAPGLPVVPETDIEYLSSLVLERDATAHWIFGSDLDGGLTDLVGENVLTPQSDSPLVRSNHISISAEPGKSLLTPFDDANPIIDTVAVVARRVGLVDSPALWGNMSAENADGGSMLRFSNNTSRYNAQSMLTGGGAGTIASSRAASTGWEILFMGRQHVASGSSFNYIKIGNGSRVVANTGGVPRPATGVNLSLGNNRYPDASGTWDIAEVIYYQDRYLVNELSELFERRKKVLALRGIAIAD